MKAGADASTMVAGEAPGVEVDSILSAMSSTTLLACEWTRVLGQVGRFVCTTMAREKLLGAEGGRLESLLEVLPASQSAAEAEELLLQTELLRKCYDSRGGGGSDEIKRCERNLESLGDVSVWLRMIGSLPALPGREGQQSGSQTRGSMTVLDVRETDACVTCIEDACECVRGTEALLLGGGEGRLGSEAFQRMYSMERGAHLKEVEDLVRECRDCVKPGLLYLDSRATQELSQIRDQLRDIETKLRTSLEETAQELFDEGLMPEKQVVFRRDRYCIPVRRGLQGATAALKGSLTLGESKTGQTVYVEPKYCVPMNNKLMKLRAEESKEETKVLKKLTEKIRKKSEHVLRVYEQVVEIDLMLARAKHAVWIGGSRPEFVRQAAGEMAVDLQGVVHPVLLEQALDAVEQATSSATRGDLPGVSPVNISIPGSCKVLTISGPNTGGKTATMKTIALCLHMAKCGLYIRTAPETRPRMAFFQAILADIGDNQSLESNLSTFSSHVTRLRDIVRVVEALDFDGSLVLLDEVGSGTNPTEGAAIAVALLRHLSKWASLTVATTHFSELKQLAGREKKEEWLNASVAFDMDTLRPTYQILLGESGASNAMHIARAIGLDGGILKEAELELSGMQSFDAVDVDEGNISMVYDSLTRQEKKARELAERAKGYMARLRDDIASLQAVAVDDPACADGELGEDFVHEMRSMLAKEEEDFYSSCVACVDQALALYESREWDHSRTDAFLRTIERGVRRRTTELAVAAQVKEVSVEAEADNALWFPKKGDRVKLKRLGGTKATVVGFNKTNQTVTVRKGTITMTCTLGDLSR